MTERDRRRPHRPRHAALGARILAAAFSVSGAVVLVTAMAEASTSTVAPVAPPAGARPASDGTGAGPAVTTAPPGARANATSRAS